MSLSPWAYVEYECRPDDLGRSHKHLVPMGDGLVCVLETEEAAELLADAVSGCNEAKHKGHGYTHGEDEPELAYRGAIAQLLIKDFDLEARQLARKIWLHRIWGGQPPAAVIMPMQGASSLWSLMMPGKDGMPVVYDVKKGALDDMMPRPTPDIALPDKSGVGYQRRRRWKLETRLRRSHDG